MKTLADQLRYKVTQSIEKAFPSLLNEEEKQAEITHCQVEEFGHYQCNSPLKLAKILKKSPKEIAEKIVSNLDTKSPSGKEMFFSKTIASPGFINFLLAPDFLSEELQNIAKDPFLGAVIPAQKQRIIVEFSSPNVAKELHVGHLRSTIIGDCIARLFEFLGQDVLRLNHIGDWGTQFGMLIAYLKKNQPDIVSGKEQADLSTLMLWYQTSKKLFDEDPSFKENAHKEVVLLQGGNHESLQIWKIICDISRKAFEEIYQILDVKIQERGESFYNSQLPLIVEDLEKKGLIQISDGAKCVFLEGFQNREGNPLPVMIQKSDGGYNYDTTEVAAFVQRIEEEKADRIIILTDASQSLHFQMIFSLVVKAKYLDPKKVQFDHVSFGVVLSPEGKKYRTREGNLTKLSDLLYEAIDRAKKILLERLPDIQDKELGDLSLTLGINAIKYADLSCHRTKDYTFSFDRMLTFEGNTASFLLYSFVRIEGIKRKASISIEEAQKISSILLEHPSEIALGLHLRRFSEVLEMMEKDLLPNRLTDYLYTLAEKFNAFFRDCHVIASDKEPQRLLLCDLTSKILKKGFDILGLKTMERM
jgi:arginyl-tRNA synthetase